MFKDGCDLCEMRAARVACEADAAKLCWECDGEVHGANTLVATHRRTLLCSACGCSTLIPSSCSSTTKPLLCNRCTPHTSPSSSSASITTLHLHPLHKRLCAKRTPPRSGRQQQAAGKGVKKPQPLRSTKEWQLQRAFTRKRIRGVPQKIVDEEDDTEESFSNRR